MKPTLVILAAGMGSRYGGLKQIDGFGPNNETVLEYSVYDAMRAGFGKIVFVIRQSFVNDFFERILKKFPSGFAWEVVFQEYDAYVPSHIQIEREKPRGTGHAVLVAKHSVNEPFAVINADDYYGVDSFRQIVKFLTNDCKSDQFGMVGYKLKETMSPYGGVNRGICTVQDGYLHEVEECLKIRVEGDRVLDSNGKHIDENSTVSMSFWAFHHSFFDHLQDYRDRFIANEANLAASEFYLTHVCDAVLKEQKARCRVLNSDARWCGVTYPEDKPFVQEVFHGLTKEGVYPTPLW